MLVALLLLVIFLATSIGVIANEKGSTVVGTITADTYVSERNTIYELEVQTEFKKGVKEFIMDFLGISTESQLMSFLGITDESLIRADRASFLLDCFRRAGISAEKILSFSNYIRNVIDPNEVLYPDEGITKEELKGIVGLWAFFCDEGDPYTNDEGVVVVPLIFNPSAHILKLFNYKLYASVFDELVSNTMLTIDEIAKVLYEIIHLSNNNSSNVITRKDFVTIFRSSSYLVSMLYDFREKGGTLPQARLLGELVYQTGSELNDMLNKNGIDYILNMFGFSSPLPSLAEDPRYAGKITDTNILEALSRLNDIRDLITSNKELMKFVVITAVESMLKIENASFEGIARVKTPGNIAPEHHKYASMISFSRSLNLGIQKGYSISEINNNELLTQKLTSIMTVSQGIDTPFTDESEKTKFEQSLSTEIANNLAAIKGVNERFSHIMNAAEIASLTEAELTILGEYYEILTDYTGTVLGLYENLLSTIFVNSVLNLYLQAQDLFYNTEADSNSAQ